MKIEIEDVQRLVVRPGETLLVTTPDPLTAAQAEHIKRLFAEALPDGVRVLVKPISIGVRVLEEAAGE